MRLHRLLAVVAVVTALILPAMSEVSAGQAAILSAVRSGVWSDPLTWGGKLPVAGDAVTVPYGTKVTLDTSPPKLKGLQVDGELTFGNVDLELKTGYLMIHGAVRAGTPEQPHTKDLTITLTGEDRSADVMGMGNRVIGVMGGSLELYGPTRSSWTQLGTSVSAGASKIRLKEIVDWKVGERIAIASTDFWALHSEERTITGVDGTVVQLDRPLKFGHFGELQTYGSRVLDERAEVALLSRNITVRGAEDSSSDGFGGHIMIMEGSAAKLQGVEFASMGQRARLRRYPVHFHMDGNAPDSFVRDSAIHHSFNRCMTIHGTSGLTVTNNVCFDHVGHGFFLEDGGETDNTLEHNLGFATREPDEPLLPSDERPATFWITNPDNTLVGNVAAGSEGIGFWYALPKHPTGLTNAEDIWPRMTPLGVFRGNVAHSNADVGLNVDHGPRPDGETEVANYAPRAVPGKRDSAVVKARFEDFTAYKNRDRGVWLRGEHHVLTGATLADNRAGATFASVESFLKRSVVIGESANKGTPESWEDSGAGGRELPFFWEPDAPIHGFEFYDGRVGVVRTKFFDFEPNSFSPSGALGYLEEDAFSIHPDNFARNVRFTRSTAVHLATPVEGYDGDASKVFVDKDGSVTGTAGRAVVVDNPFLLDDSCDWRAEWNAHVCATRYTTLMVGSADGDPNDIKPVILTRSDGTKQRLVGCCGDSDAAITSLFPGETYDVKYNSLPNEMQFVLIYGPEDFVNLRIPVTSVAAVTNWGWPVDKAGSIAELNAADESAYFFDRAAGSLLLRLHGEGGDWNEIIVRR